MEQKQQHRMKCKCMISNIHHSHMFVHSMPVHVNIKTIIEASQRVKSVQSVRFCPIINILASKRRHTRNEWSLLFIVFFVHHTQKHTHKLLLHRPKVCNGSTLHTSRVAEKAQAFATRDFPTPFVYVCLWLASLCCIMTTSTTSWWWWLFHVYEDWPFPFFSMMPLLANGCDNTTRTVSRSFTQWWHRKKIQYYPTEERDWEVLVTGKPCP